MLELCVDQHSQLRRGDHFKICDKTRITEEGDLLSTSGLEKALEAARKPGTHVVISILCTGGTTWTYVDEKHPDAEQRTQAEHKRFQRLLRAAELVAQVAMKHGGWTIIGLPRHNRYWNWASVKDVCHKFDLKFSHLDGCAFGLKSSTGDPIMMPWRFATNCVPIYERLNGVHCRGRGWHRHAIAQGQETKGTGTYPFLLAAQMHAGYHDACSHTEVI